MRRHADLILVNGTVYTLPGGKVSSIAFRDGRVMAVGGAETLEWCRGPETRLMDLGGAVVIPGLIDCHLHMEAYGFARLEIDLANRDRRECVQMVAARVRDEAPGAWVHGRGWNHTLWPDGRYPTRHELDAASPHNPVLLKRACGHACWVNSAALRLAGIDRNTPDPPSGEIVRDETGEPTGVLVEKAMDMVTRVIPAPCEAGRRRAVIEADGSCLGCGITSIHDPGIDPAALPLIERLVEEGAVHVRLYEMLSWDLIGPEYLQTHRPVSGLHGDRLTVRSIKGIADGSLGTRSAAMLDDYSDRAGWKGVLNYSPQQMAEMVASCLGAGWQLAVHCIGDRAVRLFLDGCEGKGHEAGRPSRRVSPPARFRCEHSQVVNPADVPRFASLGLIPSMQPIHATSDMNMAGPRLGPERLEGAYAWRSFLDAGLRIAAGSDAPVEDPNPFLGIYAAVTRQDRQGNPPGGWFARQLMSRNEALRAFTLDAAYAAFEENLKGSLEPGKLADAVIIDRDIIECPAEEIPGTRVLGTFVGGELVYRAEGW